LDAATLWIVRPMRLSNPVGYALGQYVHLEAEVTATADQVAQRARAEIILGHRDGLDDDECRASWVIQ
jgi:hypothetical protein